jgi:8-oxo-dGTP diphosphatase
MITEVIAKTLVFDNEGKLLILWRSARDEHRPGGPDLPGGRVEEGEDIMAAALREAEEEAGIVIDPSQIHWAYADTVAAYNEEHKTKINMVRATFIARVDNPAITLSGEHDDFSWHTMEEALEVTAGLRYVEILNHLKKNNIATDLWQK